MADEKKAKKDNNMMMAVLAASDAMLKSDWEDGNDLANLIASVCITAALNGARGNLSSAVAVLGMAAITMQKSIAKMSNDGVGAHIVDKDEIVAEAAKFNKNMN